MKPKLSILTRYLTLLILMFTTPLIYKVFSPLTIYPSFYLIKLFFIQTTLINNTILINEFPIQIISACIGASAYLLLLILNLSTPMSIKKRIQTLAFSISTLLIINILRIFLLSILAYKTPLLFTTIHNITWLFLNTLFVVLIWFLTIKLFKIKAIPIYTDFKSLT